MSYKQFIDKDDMTLAKRNLKLFSKDLIISGILGFALTLQLKKIPNINFLNLNPLLRFPIRFFTFFAPYNLIFLRRNKIRFDQIK